MFQYFDKIRELLDMVEHTERPNILKAIDAIVKANLEKSSIYIFGASHAGILSEELYYRAGGMITINAIFARELMLDRQPITFTSTMERLEGYGTAIASTIEFHRGDILILHSVSGRNPVIIDMAMAAQKKGVCIIALTNLTYSQSVSSRHSSGKRLFELADIVIDNHGEIGDAACNIAGTELKVGPTSTVIGAAILDDVIVEASRAISKKTASQVPVFYSANLEGGDIENKRLVKEYTDMIHYNF